jgi:predicted TIM-barrel fold metal-dependent hydrolase
MHDACRRIIRAYGPERCLWGSAFPCELWCPRTTHAQHPRLFTHELGLDQHALESILGKTAHALYFERMTSGPATTKGLR